MICTRDRRKDVFKMMLSDGVRSFFISDTRHFGTMSSKVSLYLSEIG